MSDKEKALPEPPSRPFGRSRHSGEREEPLMADRIAKAMAEGKLEEFMSSELPDSEHARKLVSMMMGMTGMVPPGALSPGGRMGGPPEAEAFRSAPPKADSGPGAPEEVVKAAREGDMEGLKGLLRKEHEARSQAGSDRPAAEEERDSAPGTSEERRVIDELMRIAADNDVSMDWLILRALRLYLRGYSETGRL